MRYWFYVSMGLSGCALCEWIEIAVVNVFSEHPPRKSNILAGFITETEKQWLKKLPFTIQEKSNKGFG